MPLDIDGNTAAKHRPVPAALEAVTPARPGPAAQFWSAAGASFPLGLWLRASYLGREYYALVTPQGIEFNGRLYGSSSAAAIAVKQVAGKSGASAVTNGWYFWQLPCVPC